MKITDFTSSRAALAVKALRENYNINLPLADIDRKKCASMLTQVRTTIRENQQRPGGQTAAVTNRNHMKLVFIEQALSNHMEYLKSRTARIVLENQTVAKSEVFLAAQDMANSLQKMVDDISEMLYKELPALVQSAENKIGLDEAAAFKQSAEETLNGMLDMLKQGVDGMNNAVNTLTGEETMPTGGAEAGMPGEEMPAAPEEPAPPTAPPPQMPTEEPTAAGRLRR